MSVSFMNLNDILKDDFVIGNLEATDKPGALSELVGFLEAKGKIQKPGDLLHALSEREKLGSTGIGDNVALPHAKSGEIQELVVLFARSVSGIDFESLDQQPVHYICLIVVPENATGSHMKALAKISKLLSDDSLREDILNAQSPEEIYSLLVQGDAKLI